MALALLERGEIVDHGGSVGISGERLLEQSDRTLEVALGCAREAQKMEGIKMPRILGQNLPAEPFGLGWLSRTLKVRRAREGAPGRLGRLAPTFGALGHPGIVSRRTGECHSAPAPPPRAGREPRFP